MAEQELGGHSVELHIFRDRVNVEERCRTWASGCFMCYDIVFTP